ncbi:glycosyltransferase family 2 protein [Enterobacter hormaechei]
MKTAVCCICKNELPYVLEWVFHYRSIGFDTVFIYDNDSDDGTSELLIQLDKAGLIKRIFWPRIENIAPQRSAYADFLEKYASDFDWTLICDMDEFFSTNFIDVKTFIANALDSEPNATAIAIPWLIFGSSGKFIHDDGAVTSRFTHCDHECSNVVKTLFKPAATYQIRTHIVDVHYGSYIDNTFKKAKWSGVMPICLHDVKDGYARIHHYFTKSKEEWVKRKSLAKADRAHIEHANLALFDKYHIQSCVNYDLYNLDYEQQVKDLECKFHVQNKINANIIFSNKTLIIFRIESNNPIKNLRLVIDNENEIISSNLIPFHDGSVGFCLNIKTKRGIFDNIKISSVDSSNRISIGLSQSPTRLDILRNVINFLPNSEYIKFNIFKRLANDPKRSKSLTSMDFGSFEKFKEYQGIIHIHRLYCNSSLNLDHIENYLDEFNGAGKLVLDEFMDISGPFSDMLNDIIRSKN